MARKPVPSARIDTIEQIKAVKTPLNFFVLGLAVVEIVIGGLALSAPIYQGVLIYTIITSIPAFIGVVVLLAFFRPEALNGDRPLHEANAHRLGDDLFLALDGSLQNLEPEERREAWETLALFITKNRGTGNNYIRFCETLSVRIIDLSNLKSKININR